MTMNPYQGTMSVPPRPLIEGGHEIEVSDHESLMSDLGMSSASVIRAMRRRTDPMSEQWQPGNTTCTVTGTGTVHPPIPTTTDEPLPRTFSRTPSQKSFVQRPSPVLLDEQLMGLQIQFGFPKGLAAELGGTRSLFPARFWILDNSGSMLNNDGSVLSPRNERVSCTRWKELQETVQYHAELAALLEATTHFRLLNDPGVRVGPQEFSIAADGHGSVSAEVTKVVDILYKAKPNGSTPLTIHLVEIIEQISEMAEIMWQKGLRAVVIIATDGLPTSVEGETSDEITKEFIGALQYLQSLPVWVVVRLCTDEKVVVDFYNELDNILDLPLEVIDDHTCEAKEIYKFNGWLNYAAPLHRCREIGYPNRIFDLLDERPLTKDEIRDLCELMFGNEHFVNVKDINADWNEFCVALTAVLAKESLQWNPLKKKMLPWIDVTQLKRSFRGGLRRILSSSRADPCQKSIPSRLGRRRKGSF